MTPPQSAQVQANEAHRTMLILQWLQVQMLLMQELGQV
jgi:hypothetical protein